MLRGAVRGWQRLLLLSGKLGYFEISLCAARTPRFNMFCCRRIGRELGVYLSPPCLRTFMLSFRNISTKQGFGGFGQRNRHIQPVAFGLGTLDRSLPFNFDNGIADDGMQVHVSSEWY